MDAEEARRLAGRWQKEESLRRFIGVARRDATEKMLGWPATTWVDVNDVVPGLAGEPVEAKNERAAEIARGVGLGASLAGN